MSLDIQSKFLRYSPRDGRTINNKFYLFQRLHLDPWLLLFISITSFLGLITLYSASGQDLLMVSKQLMSFGIGLIIMFILAQIPPKFYQSLSPFFYAFGLLGLIAVFFIGEIRLGAQRWISLPGVGSVQPSEFMKGNFPLRSAAVSWILFYLLFLPFLI